MKIICDSSSIITLADNCVMYLLKALSEKGADFIIPHAVKKEIVDTPISTKKFKFEAVRIKEALRDGWIKVYTNDSNKNEVRKVANRIMDASNSLFSVGGRKLNIIQYGEAEALALANVTGITTILVDEKNTRMLIESPEALAEVMGRRFGKKVEIDSQALKILKKELRGMEVIRSSEVVMVSYEQGLLDRFIGGSESLDRKDLVIGVLYSLRGAGCSITDNEIRQYYEEMK